jgi:hypothetical protein
VNQQLGVSCLSYGSCDFVVELYSEPWYTAADINKDATFKSEVFFNTTDRSLGRRVMSDKPNESSAKSVTGSNKRALRASEVFFNTTDGHPSGLRETSFPVPPASKEWTNWFVYLYPTLVF